MAHHDTRYQIALFSAFLGAVALVVAIFESASEAALFLIALGLFALPGLGRLAFDSTLAHDFKILQGIVFLVTLAVVAANLLTDIIYGLLDPRIRYQ